jgi:XTP/dITP diphosphohydrolase
MNPTPTLIFGTNNAHKLQEVREILEPRHKILSLNEVNFVEEVPENEPTILDNAVFKAEFLYKKLGQNVFSDDTGLEVNHLGGAPGVLSARYAGVPPDSGRNVAKLLEQMQGVVDRSARFRTVIALIINGKLSTFEGVIEGSIAKQPVGTGGFGYDAVFLPLGFARTFAELSPSTKNEISHRALAVAKMVAFLNHR